MQEEIEAEGKTVQFVGINIKGTESEEQQSKLADECTFPLLQDTEEADAWGALEGTKDDFYIYGSDGTLVAHLPARAATSTNLSEEDGYAYVLEQILAAP